MRLQKLNPGITSKINRSTVLALIHRHPLVSRAQLATLTGLDRSTITHILKDLLEEKLVEEVQKGKAGSRGGRCPILLQVRYDTKFLIAVNVGTQRIEGVITNLKGDEIDRHEVALGRGEPLLERIIQLLDELRSQRRRAFQKSIVIGITCPGVIDPEKGVVRLNLFHDWRDVELAEPLGGKYGKPVFVENDANAAAMGELQHLEAAETRTLLYFLIRESAPESESLLGVGGAVVFGGRLWHGSHHCAGEVSPTINTLIQRMAFRRMDKNNFAQGRKVSLDELLHAAVLRDEASLRIVDAVADQIGKYLSEVAAFLDPEGVMVYIHPPEDKEDFFAHIREAFYRHHDLNGKSAARFLKPQMGKQAMLLGIIALAQERIFVQDANHTSLLFQ